MNRLKPADMYTCHLLKLYYKLYRNTTRIFRKFYSRISWIQPQFTKPSHSSTWCRLCEFGKLNANYQMHLRLRELAIPANPQINHLIDIKWYWVNHFLFFSGYLCLPRLIPLNAILITLMYVKIQWCVRFACINLACILSTTYVSHKHKPHCSFFFFFFVLSVSSCFTHFEQ